MTFRQTKQKDDILHVIRGVNRHMTAEEVHQAVLKTNPSIGIATVYRNLNRLADTNEITRVIDKDVCYYDGNSEPHYHVHCVNCGRYHDAVIEYQTAFDQMIATKHDIKVIGHHITFDCVCESCLHQNDKK